MAYWLFKSEPFKFSFDDLKESSDQITTWDGIRNYQARNFLRDQVKLGDKVLFYHSRIDPPCIVGVAEVVKESYPDHTSWDTESDYYDPNSSPDNPCWIMVDIQFKEDFLTTVSLEDLKENPKLEGLLAIKKGQRLSIQPVEESHFKEIIKMGGL